MNNNNYINLIEEYIESEDFLIQKGGQEFYNKVFFTYPSTCIDKDHISKILNEVAKVFEIPYKDIKIIGSSHIGFSLVKKGENNEPKIFDKEKSDIDIAIINNKLFYEVFSETLEATNFYEDLTQFKDAGTTKYYKKMIAKGFIRPDTVGSSKFRNNWMRAFEEISQEFNMKISGAIYLDEHCFRNRLENSMKVYKKERMDRNGVK